MRDRTTTWIIGGLLGFWLIWAGVIVYIITHFVYKYW